MKKYMFQAGQRNKKLEIKERKKEIKKERKKERKRSMKIKE